MAKRAVDVVSVDESRGESQGETPPDESPRVVFVQAPVLLGRLIRREDDQWIALIGGAERVIRADSSVDPALLEDAMERGVKVIIDQSEEPLIAGVVATQRSLVVDRDGAVDAEVEHFKVSARREVLLKTPGAFIRARRAELEVFGDKVLTRGREVAKILAAMIELN